MPHLDWIQAEFLVKIKYVNDFEHLIIFTHMASNQEHSPHVLLHWRGVDLQQATLAGAFAECLGIEAYCLFDWLLYFSWRRLSLFPSINYYCFFLQLIGQLVQNPVTRRCYQSLANCGELRRSEATDICWLLGSGLGSSSNRALANEPSSPKEERQSEPPARPS